TFDVNEHIDATHIVAVMEKHPELFSDLPEIPEEAAITEGYSFQPE
ncbi:MAG: ABC transporter substrate-binding protein, partial [Phyllobacteriaceae bacterium]|nr:ABC transporter substrate-binding protein [Phyllobacteriaceae bacterium]